MTTRIGGAPGAGVGGGPDEEDGSGAGGGSTAAGVGDQPWGGVSSRVISSLMR